MVQIRLILVMAVALGASGCGGNMNRHLRKQAGLDLNCSESQVHLSTITREGAQYLAQAWGRRAVYTYARETGAVRISAMLYISAEMAASSPSAMACRLAA